MATESTSPYFGKADEIMTNEKPPPTLKPEEATRNK
jgi:hypothetical protein